MPFIPPLWLQLQLRQIRRREQEAIIAGLVILEEQEDGLGEAVAHETRHTWTLRHAYARIDAEVSWGL